MLFKNGVAVYHHSAKLLSLEDIAVSAIAGMTIEDRPGGSEADSERDSQEQGAKQRQHKQADGQIDTSFDEGGALMKEALWKLEPQFAANLASQDTQAADAGHVRHEKNVTEATAAVLNRVAQFSVPGAGYGHNGVLSEA